MNRSSHRYNLCLRSLVLQILFYNNYSGNLHVGKIGARMKSGMGNGELYWTPAKEKYNQLFNVNSTFYNQDCSWHQNIILKCVNKNEHNTKINESIKKNKLNNDLKWVKNVIS